MGSRKTKVLRRSIVEEVRTIERRISQIDQVLEYLDNPAEDMDFFIVASSPSLGPFTALLSGRGLDTIKPSVIVDLVGKKRSDQNDLKYAIGQYELLISKTPLK